MQVIDHFKIGSEATNVDVLRTINWRYFPRWSPYAMEAGLPWKVFGMQGRRKIWYAGSSVLHESVRAVLDYNNLLLEQMKTN